MQQYLKNGAAIIGLSVLLIGVQALADNTSTPPTNNAAAPLNVTNSGQIKDGGLSIYWTGLPKTVGFVVKNGWSGFGITTPKATVDVNGSIYTEGGSGDMNASGTITASDALKIWQYYERNTTLSRELQANADMDGNGVITFEDVIMSLGMAVGFSREEAEYNAYHFILPSCGTFPNADVNESGSVTAADAQLALQFAVGSADPSGICQAMRADYDQSGRITASDAQFILQNAVGLCEDGNRGTTRMQKGGAGVKDAFQVCAKDAGGNMAWRTLY